MALDGTYSGLLASAASWLKRTDLTSSLPDLVALAESRISRDLRLRMQIVEVVLTATPNVRNVTLPTDWLELENVSLAAPSRQLSYITIEQMDSRFDPATTGTPIYYSIEGELLQLAPTPFTALGVSVIYYQRLPSVITAGTNLLLQKHPAIYLFAVLAEAEPFLVNDERSALWNAKYLGDVKALQDQDDRATHSGSVLRVRTN